MTTPPAPSRTRRERWAAALGLHRPELRAWAMYDWGNSAFATTIMAAVLPIFYADVAASTLPENLRTAYWAYTTSIALLIIAVLSPILGAMADYLGAKKKFLLFFLTLGIVFTSFLFFVDSGEWVFASVVFIVANIGFAGANVFYESLLPHIAEPDEVDRVSTAGYAMGYVGGGILLAVNLAWIMAPDRFGFADAGAATRWSFVSVSVWWALFAIPLFRRVPEPPRRSRAGEVTGQSPIRVGIARVVGTLSEIREYRQVFLFLVAFWFYNDGIGTIIKLATIYGREIGIGQVHLIGALLLVQFLGIPFTFLFGGLASRIGPKRGIYVALMVYTVISVIGYGMRTPAHFWMLAVCVATVQGGAQALTRSLYASLVPRTKSSEFFGFFSVSAKFAGIFGPLLFGLIGQLTGASRLSILAISLFFLFGMLLLSRVDVEAGREQARRADAEMLAGA